MTVVTVGSQIYMTSPTQSKLELEQNMIKQEMSYEVHTNRKTPGQSTQRAKVQSGTDGKRMENASYYYPIPVSTPLHHQLASEIQPSPKHFR